jgi:hypothetical protein
VYVALGDSISIDEHAGGRGPGGAGLLYSQPRRARADREQHLGEVGVAAVVTSWSEMVTLLAPDEAQGLIS